MILHFLLILILIRQITGSKSVLNLTVTRGEIVHLNCTLFDKSASWLVPGKDGKLMTYSNDMKINIELGIPNLSLESDYITRNYNLIISNFSNENIGLYECRALRNLDYIVIRYRVILEDKSMVKNEISTLSPGSGNNSKSNEDEKPFIPIFGGITCGLVFLLMHIVVFFCYKKRHRMQDFQTTTEGTHYDEIGPIENNNFELLSRQNIAAFRDTDGTGLNTTVPNVLLIEHTIQQGSMENVIADVESESINEISSTESDGYENPYQPLVQENNSEEHLYCGYTIKQKINDTGLNYSEVLHEPGPSSEVIHGFNERTSYAEIDHSVTVISHEKDEQSID